MLLRKLRTLNPEVCNSVSQRLRDIEWEASAIVLERAQRLLCNIGSFVNVSHIARKMPLALFPGDIELKRTELAVEEQHVNAKVM